MEKSKDGTIVMNESMSDEEADDNEIESINENKNQGNVRSRVEQLVKSKFVGIVNEIRKSSPPIVVRRWVDSTSHIATTTESSDVEELKPEVTHEEDQHSETKESDCSHVYEEPPRKITNSFTSILTKLNLRAFDRQSLDTTESDSVPPPQSGGNTIKTTLSEFYEKFNNNRDRYQSIQTRKIDIKRMLSRTKVSEEKTDDETVINKNETLQEDDQKMAVDAPIFVLTSNDANIDWGKKPPADPSIRPRPRKLGRCASECQPGVEKRKSTLSTIGRSFSVVETEDETVEFPNENSGNIFVTINESEHVSCPSLQASSRSINVISPFPTTTSESGRFGRRKLLQHEASIQSDSSYCSSVDSLLDARKPDPEAILRACGFGPPRQEDVISKIPKRFLKPSQVRGIDTIEFLKRQKFASQIHDSSAYGYRGLIGNPHIQASMIVLKMRERFVEMNIF